MVVEVWKSVTLKFVRGIQLDQKAVRVDIGIGDCDVERCNVMNVVRI